MIKVVYYRLTGPYDEWPGGPYDGYGAKFDG